MAIRRQSATTAAILAVALLVPAPAFSTPIDPGFDLFTTGPGSFVDLNAFDVAGVYGPLVVQSFSTQLGASPGYQAYICLPNAKPRELC